MSQSTDKSVDTTRSKKTPSPQDSASTQDRLAPGEWPVLRACWRLGPGATMQAIVRETQREVLHDYKHTQTLLRRLQKKGLLRVEQISPRRILWSASTSPQETLRHEAGIFVRQIAGRDRHLIGYLRQALDELEAMPLESSPGDARLPDAIRVRLIELLTSFLAVHRYRQPLARALDIPTLALDLGTGSTLSSSIELLTAAGGDTSPVALRVLETIQAIIDGDDDLPAVFLTELDSLLSAVRPLAAAAESA